ncbi:phosphatase PAP2 family protein [Streptomyces sp. NPDC001594]|uniref:phosphatase PAP2 family protein n=1 Tax=Streptomyces sp. NPDC001594 TaxID=3364590 RepID=UPI0036CE56B5
MAGLTTGGPNVDVSLLYRINSVARSAPEWLDRGVGLLAAYGLPLAMVLLVLWCWRGARRQDEAAAAESFAALVWAPLAAALALMVNVPLRGFVARPRPFVAHEGLEVLGGVHVGPDAGFTFVSDHATLAMALGIGVFLANRRLGLVGIGLALAEGLCRVYLGVHYPTDVIGGFALGTAVVLLLAPLAMAGLTPLARALARTPRLGLLVRAGERVVARPVELAQRPGESDLAA